MEIYQRTKIGGYAINNTLKYSSEEGDQRYFDTNQQNPLKPAIPNYIIILARKKRKSNKEGRKCGK